MRRRLPLALLALATVLTVAPSGAETNAWTPTLPLPQQGFDLLSAFRGGTAYVEHTNGGDNLLVRSTDHGMTWTPVEMPASGGTIFVRFASPTHGVAVPFGLHHAYRTTDGAKTWTKTAPYPVPRTEHFTAGSVAVHGRTIVVTGQLRKAVPTCTGSSVAMMVSDDFGTHWRRSILPTPGGAAASGYSLRAFSPRDAAVVVYEEEDPCATLYDQTAVYVTHDGGRTFARREVCPVICTAVGWALRTALFVGRVDGTTAASADGGRTFREAARLTNAGAASDELHAFWVQAFAFQGRIGYASTKFGGTWRTTSGGGEWTREVSHESAFGLGVGDVAMFDAQRAIAGGPSFVSTRQGVGPSVAAPAPAPSAAGPTVLGRYVLRPDAALAAR